MWRAYPFPGPIGPGLIEAPDGAEKPGLQDYFPAQLGRASLKQLVDQLADPVALQISRPNWAGPH